MLGLPKLFAKKSNSEETLGEARSCFCVQIGLGQVWLWIVFIRFVVKVSLAGCLIVAIAINPDMASLTIWDSSCLEPF